MRDFVRRLMIVGLAMLAAGVIVACKPAPKPTPINELTKQEVRGRTVFMSRCSACHYDRQDAPLHGPSLSGVFKKPILPSGAAATDERVTATIHIGRGLMPPLGDTIDAQDLNDLLAYLHTL